ncbi:hypothetical protein ACFVXC_32360 [Streptomyces sp. NPDC058257]
MKPAELTPDDLLKQHCFYDAYYKDYQHEVDHALSGTPVLGRHRAEG